MRLAQPCSKKISIVKKLNELKMVTTAKRETQSMREALKNYSGHRQELNLKADYNLEI